MPYTNLPPGATHKDRQGRFYQEYNFTSGPKWCERTTHGWLKWDSYHKAWRHYDGVMYVEKLE